MKKLLVTLTAVLISASTFGQGTIQFNNRTGPIDAPVTRQDGTGAGAGVTAQLFLVQGGVYTPLTPTTTFRTTSPAAAFYVTQPATAVTVPGIAAANSATIVMRAWEGASFDSATVRGESTPITITLGGDVPGSAPLPPALLTGLQGFTLVPEPSTIALGLLGAAALLYRRRS